MKHKFIAISNIKGGVGKSCISGIFCNFLAERGVPVDAVDADIQQSLNRRRERELAENPGVKVPWPIQPLDTSNPEVVKAELERRMQGTGCTVIDCPGNINDPGLALILQTADIIVVPTRYDMVDLDATCLFVKVCKAISNAKMFFVPNCIAVGVESPYELDKKRAQARSLLSGFGYVTSRIKESVVVKNYSTLFPLTSYQRNAVKYAFEPIIDFIVKEG